KRRVWKVGEAAMAWGGAVAKELARDGLLRQQNDPDVFAEPLAGPHVPTRAEIEERRERDAVPAGGDGPDVAVPAGRRRAYRRAVTRPARPGPPFPFRTIGTPHRRE